MPTLYRMAIVTASLLAGSAGVAQGQESTATLTAGRAVYQQHCAACHGKDAEGGVENGARVIVDSGTTLAVQPPLEHAFEPDGRTDLFAVQLYMPPGPEQRFKALAAKSGK